MRVLIVDDERLARNALEMVLRSRSDVESVDSAVDAMQALEMFEKRPYDVLLLDINLPELSGIELAGRLKRDSGLMPSIVFVTAHDQHAITAFEKHAVDYVLKPFSERRIHDALDTAARRTHSERAAQLAEMLPRLERFLPKPSRIAIKTKGSVLIVDAADVATVEAQGNYVLLQRLTGSYLLRESITEVARKLEPHGFIRIHRSVLVNTAFVEEVTPWRTGEYILRIRGGKELTVSRTYKKNLKALAQFWFGTSGLPSL